MCMVAAAAFDIPCKASFGVLFTMAGFSSACVGSPKGDPQRRTPQGSLRLSRLLYWEALFHGSSILGSLKYCEWEAFAACVVLTDTWLFL